MSDFENTRLGMDPIHFACASGDLCFYIAWLKPLDSAVESLFDT